MAPFYPITDNVHFDHLIKVVSPRCPHFKVTVVAFVISNFQFIHLLISIWTHYFLFYSVGYNLSLSFSSMPKLSPVCPLEIHSSWLLCPLDMSPSFFEYFLALGDKTVFQAHLVLSLSNPWNQPFIRSSLIPLEETSLL